MGGWGVSNGLVVFSTPSNSNGSAVVGCLVRRNLKLTFSVSTADHPPHNDRQRNMRCFFLAPRRFHSHVTRNRFLRCRRICPGHFCNALGRRIRHRLRSKRRIIFSISIMNNYGVGRFCNGHTLSVFVRPPSVGRLHHHLRNHNASTPRVVRRQVSGTRCRLSFTSGFSGMVIGSSLIRTGTRTLTMMTDFLI